MLFFHAPNHRITSLQVVRARIAQQFIDRGPVELSFGGLDELPGHRREHGVEVHRLQPRPVRAHVFGARALELPSSPPRIRNGLPSTMSCCVVPCFARRGGAACAAMAVASAARTTMKVFKRRMLAKPVRASRWTAVSALRRLAFAFRFYRSGRAGTRTSPELHQMSGARTAPLRSESSVRTGARRAHAVVHESRELLSGITFDQYE